MAASDRFFWKATTSFSRLCSKCHRPVSLFFSLEFGLKLIWCLGVLSVAQWPARLL